VTSMFQDCNRAWISMKKLISASCKCVVRFPLLILCARSEAGFVGCLWIYSLRVLPMCSNNFSRP
jgi:hypothetical protein